MNRVRISSSPCLGLGIGDSFTAKFSCLGSPVGRLAMVHARLIASDNVIPLFGLLVIFNEKIAEIVHCYRP